MENISLSEQLLICKSLYENSFKSKFYQDKYSSNYKIDSYEDWLSLPILTRDEIYQNSIPRSKSMLTVPLTDMIIISTGGSSGVARYTAYTNEEWDAFVTTQSKAIKILGVHSEDVIANLFVAGHFWPSFLGLHDTIKKIKAVHLPISANIPPEEIVKLCLEFEPTVMISLPTLFVFLADMAARDGFEFKKLRMIQYAGEHLSSQAENHIKKHLKVENIKSGAYTSSDAGMMGYQCLHCEPGVYHIPTAFQFIEIINFDTNQVCKPNEIGEIVVTNLSRKSTPIIRYRVGDAAYLLPDKCICGDPNPLLKLAGRAGQDFKIGGAFISFDEIENSIAKFSDYFSLNYQLVLEDVDNKLVINLLIESGFVVSSSVIQQLKDDLFNRIKEFAIGTEKGYISQFEIKIVGLGQLPRSNITGKVKKLEDKRVK